MAKIDKDLAAALKTAKTKKMFFALVEKAPGEGTLIVSRNPIASSAISQAQRELGGGGKIFKGQCATEPGTDELVFETETDPPAVRTLKAVIARDAGLTLKVDSRKAKPALIDSIRDTISADAKADAEKRLSGITGGAEFRRARAQGGLVAESMDKQVEKVRRLIDARAWPQANAAMDDLEQMAARPTEDL
ncbi:MAG: hypothetical protein AB7Q97_00080 [Gammaproteobacteria bacterium]